MAIRRILSYLVAPGKGKDPLPDIHSADLPRHGRLYDMLEALYNKAERDCDSSIRFLAAEDGSQVNDVRDLVLSLLERNDIRRGRALAEYLSRSTTFKSGLGLLFLIIGRQERSGNVQRHKLVISRFPAEAGILANEVEGGLDVEFVERVFMKNQKTYKAALYTGTSLNSGFWKGRAVDKQMDGTAAYWIKGFLKSDLLTTPAEGTRRLANALMAATRECLDLDDQEEIVAMSRLIRQTTDALSANELLERFGARDAVKKLVLRQFPRGDLANDRFKIDIDEYDKIVKYRSVRLDSGGIMTAQAEEFDEIFRRQHLEDGRVRFETEGTIRDDRLKKTGR